MHTALVFLHVLCAALFLLAHGAAHVVVLRIAKERSPERLRALLDLSASSYMLMMVPLGFLSLFGVAAGFSAKWWGSGWIWLAMALLLAIAVLMYMFGQRNYAELRLALGMPVYSGQKRTPRTQPATHEEIAALAAAVRPVPTIIAGVGGLIVIVWLMVFRLF